MITHRIPVSVKKAQDEYLDTKDYRRLYKKEKVVRYARKQNDRIRYENTSFFRYTDYGFMLISGKPEVTLSSFIVAAAVPVITGLYGALVCYAILFAVFFSYYQLIFHLKLPVFHSAVFSVIGILAFIVQRIIPFMLLGTVIKKQKNISESTMALERMRLSRGIILSIAVMFRYFPAIKDDSCGGFHTPVLCTVMKGIKTDCNHLMRTTSPMLCVGVC